MNNLKYFNEYHNKFADYHYYQQEGHTCGPSCVKMVCDYLNVPYTDFKYLIDICDCDDRKGTTDIGIKNALTELGINFKQNPYIGNEQESLKLIDDTLKKGNIFLMRSLTLGIKHWLVVYGKDNTGYLVADPWIGLKKYSAAKLNDIWKPRDFDGFIVYV